MKNFEGESEDRFSDFPNTSFSRMDDEEEYFESCSQLDQDSFEFRSFRKDHES